MQVIINEMVNIQRVSVSKEFLARSISLVTLNYKVLLKYST